MIQIIILFIIMDRITVSIVMCNISQFGIKNVNKT